MFVCSVAQVEEWNREIECAFLKRAQRDNDDRTSFSSDYDYSKMQEGLGNKKEEDGGAVVENSIGVEEVTRIRQRTEHLRVQLEQQELERVRAEQLQFESALPVLKKARHVCVDPNKDYVRPSVMAEQYQLESALQELDKVRGEN